MKSLKNNTLLRVVILTQGKTRIVDPLCNSGHQIVGIVECAPRTANLPLSSFGRLKKKFFPSRDPEKKLRHFAEDRNIPFFYLDKSDMAAFATWLGLMRADVMVVYSMSYLLKENIFSIPQYGTINLHPSYLPEYPGRNPWFWTYYNTDLNPGVTLHYVDSGEDTGDIIRQERFNIPLGIKSSELYDIAIGQVGTRLILQTLDELAKGQVIRFQQGTKGASPKARQVKENEVLIDFQSWQIEKIWHLLRGTETWYKPIPQPAGLYAGQHWVVDGFEKTSDIEHQPGTISKYRGKYRLATGEGYIFLTPTKNKKIFIKNIIKFFTP